MALTLPNVIQLEQLAKEVEEDPKVRGLRSELQIDSKSHPKFQLIDGYLLYKGRLYLPKGSALIPLLLKEGHDNRVGVHSRVLKTYK